MSVSWRTTNLSFVAEINPRNNGRRHLTDDQPVSFVPMTAVSEESAAIEALGERLYKDVKKGYTSFCENDVLFAKITPCMENGKIAIARNLLGGVGFGSTEFHILRAKRGVLPEFIYYFLRQESVRATAKQRMQGAVGQRRVPVTFLEEYPFPLPPPSEQRRIVEILDKADALRRKRAEADAKAARILPALFLKMFGDPATNPQGWAIKKLGSVGTLDRGRSQHRPRNAPELYNGPYPFVQTGDISNSPKFQELPTSQDVTKNEASYRATLTPLLRHSRMLRIVDPYMTWKEACLRTIRLCAELLGRGSHEHVKRRIQIHTDPTKGNNGHSLAQGIHEWQTALQPIIARFGHDIEVFLWETRTSDHRFHDRFLLTDQCGIGSQDSFECVTGAASTTRWFLLSPQSRQNQNAALRPETTRYIFRGKWPDR